MKEKQWKIYEQEAKAEYLKERKRFELALQKIDQEIKEVTGNGQEASKQVQALATNGLATKQARADNGREMWETMLAEPEAAPEPGFFRDALLAAQQAKAQPTAHSASGSAESGLMTAEAATQLLQATLAQLPSEVLRAMGTVPTAEPTLGPSWLLEAGQRQQHQQLLQDRIWPHRPWRPRALAWVRERARCPALARSRKDTCDSRSKVRRCSRYTRWAIRHNWPAS